MTKAEDMYIISALHEIPILTKRIEKQKEDLTKYASSISNFTPEFGTTEAQRKEVEKLLQSTLDLIERQRWLKRCIAFTNAVSKIEIDGFTYSVTELLAIKSEARSVSYGGRRTSAETNPARDQSCCVYECLNDGNGKSLLAQYNRGNDKEGVSVVLYYDEAKKKARYDKWYDFVTKITSELEIFNARTKLMDPEDYTLTPKEKQNENKRRCGVNPKFRGRGQQRPFTKSSQSCRTRRTTAPGAQAGAVHKDSRLKKQDSLTGAGPSSLKGKAARQIKSGARHTPSWKGRGRPAAAPELRK